MRIRSFLIYELGQRLPCLRQHIAGREGADPETGLWRMAAFAASAEQELARAARFRRPLSLLVLKIVPEAAPSRAGIQRFASALRRHTRGFDLIGRADDGCFLIVLPEAGPAEAAVVTGRILADASACLGMVNGTGGSSPIRIGSAASPDDGILLKELLAQARARLDEDMAQTPAQPPAEADERLDDGRLRRFVMMIAAAGAALLACSLPFISPERALQVIPFLILAVVAERLTYLDYGKVSVSLATIITMAAAAMGGPAVGALVGFVSALTAWHLSRLPLVKGAFNAGNLTLSGAAAGLPYWLLGGLPALSPSPAMLLPGVAAGLVYIVVNSVLLAMVIARATGSTGLAEWRLRFNWQVVHYGVFGMISLGLAALYGSYGLTGLLLLLGPAGMLFYAQRQYISHTAAHVTELSQLNQELTGSNEQLLAMNERLEGTLGELRQANESLLTALSEALELRDQETEGHSRRVVHYAQATALALGLPAEQIETVVHGALLHDIGKIGVSDAILLKPGRLTADEWAEMKRHAEIGYQMIAGISFLAPAADLVRYHHERWDGGGYPHGLAGSQIPLGARIFAVVDAFDAMTSDRPYRAALPLATAIEELQRGSGSQFDPAVAATFCRLITSGVLAAPSPASAGERLVSEGPARSLVVPRAAMAAMLS